MMRSVLFSALIVLLLFAPSVFAYSYTIADNYESANDNNHGDVIGAVDHFGIERVEVGFSGGFINVEIYTPFEENIAGFGTEFSDLFISTNGWCYYREAPYKADDYNNGEKWEYVFDTSEDKLNGDTIFTLTGEAPPQEGGNDYIVRDGQEVLYGSGGSEIAGDGSGFSDESKGTFLSYALNLPSLGDIAGDVGLKWSMTCANDSIEGSVPVPTPRAFHHDSARFRAGGAGSVPLAQEVNRSITNPIY